jgi:hypothetical protein
MARFEGDKADALIPYLFTGRWAMQIRALGIVLRPDKANGSDVR